MLIGVNRLHKKSRSQARVFRLSVAIPRVRSWWAWRTIPGGPSTGSGRTVSTGSGRTVKETLPKESKDPAPSLVRQGEGWVLFLGLVAVRSGSFVSRVRGGLETRPYVKKGEIRFLLLFPFISCCFVAGDGGRWQVDERVFPSSCGPFPMGEAGILTGVDGTWFPAWISVPPVLPRMTGVPGGKVCARVAGPFLVLSFNSRGGLSRVGRGWCQGNVVIHQGLSIVGGNSSSPFVVSLENQSGRPFDGLRANGGRDSTKRKRL